MAFPWVRSSNSLMKRLSAAPLPAEIRFKSDTGFSQYSNTYESKTTISHYYSVIRHAHNLRAGARLLAAGSCLRDENRYGRRQSPVYGPPGSHLYQSFTRHAPPRILSPLF